MRFPKPKKWVQLTQTRLKLLFPRILFRPCPGSLFHADTAQLLAYRSSSSSTDAVRSERTKGKEPKINRFRQNKHAISQSRSRRSGDWRFPWGLSHRERSPFQALTSQSRPKHSPDRSLLQGKK